MFGLLYLLVCTVEGHCVSNTWIIRTGECAVCVQWKSPQWRIWWVAGEYGLAIDIFASEYACRMHDTQNTQKKYIYIYGWAVVFCFFFFFFSLLYELPCHGVHAQHRHIELWWSILFVLLRIVQAFWWIFCLKNSLKSKLWGKSKPGTTEKKRKQDTKLIIPVSNMSYEPMPIENLLYEGQCRKKWDNTQMWFAVVLVLE